MLQELTKSQKKHFPDLLSMELESLQLLYSYVAVIYPGTKHMSSNEVIKFTKYGSEIATKMNKNNIFKTIMIDCNNCSINVLP